MTCPPTPISHTSDICTVTPHAAWGIWLKPHICESRAFMGLDDITAVTLWATHVQGEIIILDWQPTDWLRREQPADADLCAASESWRDLSLPRHPLSLPLAKAHWVIPLRFCSRMKLHNHPKCETQKNKTKNMPPIDFRSPRVDSSSNSAGLKVHRGWGSRYFWGSKPIQTTRYFILRINLYFWLIIKHAESRVIRHFTLEELLHTTLTYFQLLQVHSFRHLCASLLQKPNTHILSLVQ